MNTKRSCRAVMLSTVMAITMGCAQDDETILIPEHCLSYLDIDIYAHGDYNRPSEKLIRLLDLEPDEIDEFTRIITQTRSHLLELMEERISIVERTGDSVHLEMAPLGQEGKAAIENLYGSFADALGTDKARWLRLVSERYWPREGKNRRLNEDRIANGFHLKRFLTLPDGRLVIKAKPAPEEGDGWFRIDFEQYENGRVRNGAWDYVTHSEDGSMIYYWVLNRYLPKAGNTPP